MSSHRFSSLMPFDGPTLLGGFFGESDHVRTVIKRTFAILVVEPIMRKRATIYIPSPVSAFLWYDYLTTSASYQAIDELFGSSYHRVTDGKSVKVECLSEAKLPFFATHEICLITSKAVYCPFNNISLANHTVVCGPLKGRWQVEELNTLRRHGWTIHHYAAGEMLDDFSNLQLQSELSLENGRLFLDEHTAVIEYDKMEDDGLISASTALRARDDAGIEVDFFGPGF